VPLPFSFRACRSAVALLALFAAPLVAQSGYQQPPDVVARILDAPATPTALPSPDKQLIVLLERPGLPSIAEISARSLREIRCSSAALRGRPKEEAPTTAPTPVAAAARRRADELLGGGGGGGGGGGSGEGSSTRSA
jgi:hypothetical protein